MKYIFVNFLPGAAGSFFSRCLNLLDNAYCLADRDSKFIPHTIDDKIKLLSYNSINDKDFDDRNWREFEHKTAHYSNYQEHHNLPADSYSIWLQHNKKDTEKLAGPDDSVYLFYIDSTEAFEWTIMNAFYKNSYLDVDWFILGKQLLNDNSVYKINLKNIISNEEGFLNEFYKVCNIINHNIKDFELAAVKKLYNEWRKTILDYDNIPKFKNKIGFLL